MSPKEIFIESLNCVFTIHILNPTSFIYILSFIYMCGSGSTKLLNTDPIWIQIHNNAFLIIIPFSFLLCRYLGAVTAGWG